MVYGVIALDIALVTALIFAAGQDRSSVHVTQRGASSVSIAFGGVVVARALSLIRECLSLWGSGH